MRKFNVYYETDQDSYNRVVEARDEEEAMYEVLEELDYDVVHIEVVGHVYIKVSPSPTAPTGGMLMNYRNEPCRGSFPATVIDV